MFETQTPGMESYKHLNISLCPLGHFLVKPSDWSGQKGLVARRSTELASPALHGPERRGWPPGKNSGSIRDHGSPRPARPQKRIGRRAPTPRGVLWCSEYLRHSQGVRNSPRLATPQHPEEHREKNLGHQKKNRGAGRLSYIGISVLVEEELLLPPGCNSAVLSPAQAWRFLPLFSAVPADRVQGFLEIAL